MSSSASSLSEDPWDNSIVSRPQQEDGIDHYNPHDLVWSWTIEGLVDDRGKSEAPMAASTESSSNKERTNIVFSRRLIWASVAALVIVIIVMVTIIVVFMGGSDNSKDKDPFKDPPTPDQIQVLEFLKSISFDSGKALTNQSSPQYAAFRWLASDSSLTQYSNVRKTQRYVLATLYESLGGNDWFSNEDWLSGKHECQWEFMECSSLQNGTLDSVGLAANNLIGSRLPPELGLLDLLHLDLSNNNVKGTLLSELGRLTTLTTLDLSDNSLTGSLFTELGSLTGLVMLNFSNNYLTGTLATELGLLKDLTILDLSENTLTGNLTTELGILASLETLDTSKNRLSGSLSSELGLLTDLATLDVSSNNLTGTLFAELELLTSLEILDISHNRLSGSIITELGLLKDLTTLDLSQNDIVGTVPVEICLLKNVSLQVDCTSQEVLCSCCGDSCLLESLLSVTFEATPLQTKNQSSPQYQAFNWLKTNNSSRQLRHNFERILQRYVLAVLYYSTGGPEWTLQDEYFITGDDQDECFLQPTAGKVQPLQDASASASSSRTPATAAVDGSFETSWTSASSFIDTPQWLELNLHQTFRFHNVSITWGDEAYATTYRVEVVATNGETTRAVTVRLFGNFRTETVEFNGALGQYLRVVLITSNLDHYSIAEVSAWGNAPVLLECNKDDKISIIALGQNNLEGTIPKELGLLSSSLEELNLSGNRLVGHVPTELSLLTGLQTFNIESNRLSGTLPFCRVPNVFLDCDEIECTCCDECK